jgi:hypothetical protein
MNFNWSVIIPGLVVLVFILILPLTALTYFVFLRRNQQLEKFRILSILEVDNHYRQIHGFDAVPSTELGRRSHRIVYKRTVEELIFLTLSVGYAMAITGLGLSLLVMGDKIGFSELPHITIGEYQFPQNGSRMVLGMAFLGSYIWGLKFLFHRYAQNDILPIVYLSFGFRMMFASLIALVMFNASDALLGGDSKGTIPLNIWPTLAFTIGMFPQRGLYWLSSKISFLSSDSHPSTREAPLDMIEGLSNNNVLRLDELGVESCYDLANLDFIPLVLKTPYSARQIIDWILQAKLCSYFGASVMDLRKLGIRHITQLESLSDEELKAISEETSVTFQNLKMAQQALLDEEQEIQRLTEVGLKLSAFTSYGSTDPIASNRKSAQVE